MPDLVNIINDLRLRPMSEVAISYGKVSRQGQSILGRVQSIINLQTCTCGHIGLFQLLRQGTIRAMASPTLSRSPPVGRELGESRPCEACLRRETSKGYLRAESSRGLTRSEKARYAAAASNSLNPSHDGFQLTLPPASS